MTIVLGSPSSGVRDAAARPGAAAPMHSRGDTPTHSRGDSPTHSRGDSPTLTDITQEARRSPHYDGHEKIVRIDHAPSGLKALIAIHDRTLGPALGGCRMWPYATEAEALTDVLRLSAGMSRKAAMADLALGGGKAVIIADSHKDKSDALFRAFGQAIEMLDGAYYTGEDVGISVADVDMMSTQTRFTVGRSDGGGGDPSPMTAIGVFEGIKAAVRHKLGCDSLDSVRIAVQGLGKVGYALCDMLHGDGAELVVADIDPRAEARAVASFGAEASTTERIHAADVELFAPCALGAVINDRTLPDLRCAIVAGSANNQLETLHRGEELRRRGILYAPDYVINAGGVIAVGSEVIPGGYDYQRVLSATRRIARTLTEIFERADSSGLATSLVADQMAGERIASGHPTPIRNGGAMR